MRLLLTRAADDARQSAERLRAQGHDVMRSPLLLPQPLDWRPPALAPEGLLLTSARAAAALADVPGGWRQLPVRTVGERSASAARAAGFADAAVPEGIETGAQLMAWAEAAGGRWLHLSGAETHAPRPPNVERHSVYRVDLAPTLGAGAEAALRRRAIDAVLLYSPRTAAHFAALLDAAGIARNGVAVACLSAAVATAAGSGWRRVEAAARADERALFAMLDAPCQGAPQGSGAAYDSGPADAE